MFEKTGFITSFLKPVAACSLQLTKILVAITVTTEGRHAAVLASCCHDSGEAEVKWIWRISRNILTC
jgi:hypothetical protein